MTRARDASGGDEVLETSRRSIRDYDEYVRKHSFRRAPLWVIVAYASLLGYDNSERTGASAARHAARVAAAPASIASLAAAHAASYRRCG